MADDGEERAYTLETAAGETLNNSRGYTGKGKATYSNGEVYDGDFEDGVLINSPEIILIALTHH